LSRAAYLVAFTMFSACTSSPSSFLSLWCHSCITASLNTSCDFWVVHTGWKPLACQYLHAVLTNTVKFTCRRMHGVSGWFHLF